MQFNKDLTQKVKIAIETAQEAGELPAFELPPIRIDRPRDPSHGDYASNTAMQLARHARMAPLKIAGIIVENLPKTDYLASADVAPPGFINFRLANAAVQNIVRQIESEGRSFAGSQIGAGKKVQVEYVSANPTGPIHIGRTRGGVIGDTLSRAFTATGHDVTREYYYNDAGNQIRLLGESTKIRYLQALGGDAQLAEEHYQGEYLEEIAADLINLYGNSWQEMPAEAFGDEAKNRIANEQKATLRRVNIEFDSFYNENDLYSTGRVYEALAALKSAGATYEKDGATWFRSTDYGDQEDRVLVKQDGSLTYRAPDIAYHWHKAERGFDQVVDIFGSDHHATAQTVLMGVQALGYSSDFVHVLIHQIIKLFRDGVEVKMSTRAGDIVPLDELVDEVGADAVRYFILQRSANSDVLFDLDLAVEQSDKNPVFYIQNAHVRCAGIFRKWAEAGGDPVDAEQGDLSLLEDENALAFLRKTLELSDILEKVVTEFEPHHLAFYAYDLAAAFHPAYESCRVLHSDVPQPLKLARLRFFRAAKIVLARVLELMGMSAPEIM